MNIRKAIAVFVCITTASILFGQQWSEQPIPGTADPLNAVVKIDCYSYQPNYWMPWMDHVQSAGSGSGVVINGNVILTAAHNVTYATYITVSKQSSDDPVEAHIKAIDHDCDLALLEVDAPGFFADIIPFAIGETPRPQTTVYVAGYPIGGNALSITQGVISRIETQFYSQSLKCLLAAQLDAAINPGNSGGPVLCEGRIVGIAFQGRRGGEGLGYMIPTEIINHFLTDLRDGKVDGFGLLGFNYALLENADTRNYLKMKEGQTGVRIYKITKQNEEYLKVDDVLLSVDGIPVSNSGNIRLPSGDTRSFSTVISQKQIGENVELKLLRNGEEVSVSLPVRKMSYQCKEFLYDQLPDYYIVGGLVFTTLSYSYLDEWERNPPEDLQSRMFMEKEYPDEEVVVLSAVLADKINAGYQEILSQIVTGVNGKPVRNLKNLIDVVENSQDEYITFYLGDNYFPVTLNLQKMREQTHAILQRYRITSDKSQSLQKK